MRWVHVGFLRQVAEMTARKLGVDKWQKEGEERVLQATGTKSLREYTERRKAKVAERVSLQPKFEVCTKETGFECGGRARGKWWRQTASEQQLKTRLKDISAASRERR